MRIITEFWPLILLIVDWLLDRRAKTREGRIVEALGELGEPGKKIAERIASWKDLPPEQRATRLRRMATVDSISPPCGEKTEPPKE